MIIKYIQLIKQITDNSKSKTNKDEKEILSKGNSRKIEKSKDLPTNIRYYTEKKNGEIKSEGYAVEMKINNKRYKKCFTSTFETMEEKLVKAKKQLEIYKSLREKKMKKKKFGSKAAKKQN